VAHVADVSIDHPAPPTEDAVARREPVGGALVTVAEVAALMRVSTMTVYRLIRGGDLQAIRVGKNFRIREDDVQRYLIDRTVAPEA
jgi:excisionase family DNA binding protein